MHKQAGTNLQRASRQASLTAIFDLRLSTGLESRMTSSEVLDPFREYHAKPRGSVEDSKYGQSFDAEKWTHVVLPLSSLC